MDLLGTNVSLHPRLIEQYPWARLPTVVAPSPENRSETITLEVSKPFILGNLHKRFRTPMLQTWFHLTGVWPPVPNLMALPEGECQPGTLLDAVACFRGIKRPCLDEDDGDSVLVYILKPESTLVFDDRPPLPHPVIKMLDKDLLLAAYVRLAERSIAAAGGKVSGCVTKLETLEAGPGEPGLPLDHFERYEKRVW